MAHVRAHRMLAEMEFPGEDYFRVLARIHEYLKPATYLEIGIDQRPLLRNRQARNARPGSRSEPAPAEAFGTPSAGVRTDQRRIF